jgi:hypothetical protein
LAAAAVFCAMAFSLSGRLPITAGQTKKPVAASVEVPDSIERFDRAIQSRFLTEPMFGMARIVSGMPIKSTPYRSRHVPSFHPNGEDEVALVDAFRNDGWRVGLYLYGRRAEPRKSSGPIEKFDVKYRINLPVAITSNLEQKELPAAKKLIDDVKAAFIEFQTGDPATFTEKRFAKGPWTFVAKPVRAVNASCVRCHTDYVITEKLADKKFTFRKRQVGDVNGVLVYAFSREGDGR